MTDLVEPGKAKAAGIVSIIIAMVALMVLICGCVYAAKGGVDGAGIWTGGGVKHNLDYVHFSEKNQLSFSTKVCNIG